MPSMISLRYTVLTPGYDGDSSSSSKHSLLMGSNVMTASSIRSLSLTTLCAVCMLFSWGNFLVPDNWLMSALKRPSGYFSAVLMKYLLFAPDPYAMRRRTTSTTRTTFLCFAASSMNRDSPFCTSSTNSSNFFAWPCPNLFVSMPWLSNICRMLTGSMVDVESSALSVTALDSSTNFCCAHIAGVHHSKLLFLSVCLSMIWNRGIKSAGLVQSSALPSGAFLACAFSRRSTNSRRRSLIPAFAPDSFTSGLKPASNASSATCAADLIEAKNGCSKQPLADNRSATSRVKVPVMNEVPCLPARDGIFTLLCLTSSSFLKGKRPVTIP
mmetsp:Transcript_51505/g.130139  ORF Transcript_51505/g.130139 Transcript_51505/m.130139 type:complete len:326 (+) Transcript_51505:950-1927(+)